MKTTFPLGLLRWLVAAATFDWLVTRTLTRAAIFMPKPPLLLLVYQGLGLAGQVALALATLLALSVLSWIAWQSWQTQHAVGLPLALWGQAGLSLLFLLAAPVGWLALLGHFIYLLAIILCIRLGLSTPNGAAGAYPGRWFACFLPALALISGRLHQALPAWYALWRWPGPAPLTELFFNLGELAVVLTPLVLWWVYGRGAGWQRGLAAALPALAFSGAHWHNAAMTGIMAVWSMGLTLYLPWPVYALTLWCAAVTVLVTLRQRDYPVGWAILLLAAGGYAPQLSVQAFLGLIALWLLADWSRQGATYPLATRVSNTALPRTSTAQPVVA